MHDEEIVRAFAPAPEPQEDTGGPDPAEEAHARGLIEGRAEARKEYEARLAESLRRTADVERQILAHCESKLIELALEAASRIVRQRVEAGDPLAQRAVQEAIDAAPSGQPLTVRLHADDAAAIREALTPEIEEGRVTIVEDDSISHGGCFVDSPAGSVDGTIETATAAVAEAVHG